MSTESKGFSEATFDAAYWLRDDPGPLLLPLVAERVPAASLPEAAFMARITGGSLAINPPWLTIADQTCRIQARRWRQLDDSHLPHLLQALPRTVLYLDESGRAGLGDKSLTDIPGVAAAMAFATGDKALAARLASDMVDQAYGHERQGLSLLLPLLEGSLRQQAVDLIVRDDSEFALQGWLDLVASGLATDDMRKAIRSNARDSGMWPDVLVAAMLAPFIDDAERQRWLLEALKAEPTSYYFADWFVSVLLVRAGRWVERGSLAPWLDYLREPYRGHISDFFARLSDGRIETVAPGSREELLRAHPAGERIAAALDAMSAQEASALCAEALASIEDRYAGAGPPAAAAPPPAASAGPSSTPSDADFATGSSDYAEAEPAEPEPPRRKRGLRGLLGSIFGGGAAIPDASVEDIESASGAPSGAVFEETDQASGVEGDEPVAADAVEADTEELADRFVQAAVLEGSQRRTSFIAGARNDLACWIGPDRKEDTAPRGVSTQPIVEGAVPPEGLMLDVVLTYEDQSQSGKVFLPKDPRSRTADCILHADIPAGETHVIAEIAFLHGGRAFEVVRIDAPALPRGEAQPAGAELRVKTEVRRREVIELDDREPVDALAVVGADHISIFGPRGCGNYTLQHTSPVVSWLNNEIFSTEKWLIRRRADGDAKDTLDAKDEDTLTFLRDLAIHGNNLYKELLHQGFEDPGERIQLLNLEPAAYVPLEFVYDQGHPVKGATLCDGWEQALESDDAQCPVCKPAKDLTAEERDAMPTICPLGFWSLQKIIERHDSKASVDGDERSAPVNGAAELPPIERVMFASSHLVEAADRDATYEVLAQNFPSAVPVDDWNDWKKVVREQGPQLLVALPHHAVVSAMDALEIGDGDQLEQGRLSHLYVTPSLQQPGPVIVLFGCETQKQSDMGYVSFARDFTRHRAAIVIGTLAKVLGRHAAPVAQSLARELAHVKERERAGKLLRRIRRRMLAQGYLMALCLVALGDGDWWLTPAPQPGETP